MKRWQIWLLAVVVLAALPAVFAQSSSTAVPKYDKASEAVFKGTIVEVRDRQCPVSGGVGSHLVMKLSDGSTVEVHLSSSKFVKQYELVFKPGDGLEITGVKVRFQDADA